MKEFNVLIIAKVLIIFKINNVLQNVQMNMQNQQ